MSNALQNGAERLEQAIELTVLQSQDAERAATPFVVKAITADPGIKALVALAECVKKEGSPLGLGADASFALHKWETGK